MDNYAKKLSIQLNINDLEKDNIAKLKELVKMHPGKQFLNFVIYDNEENIKLQMPSRQLKVKISQELLEELESSQVFYKLN